MNRAVGSDDALFTVLLEHRLFLPVLQHFQLSGDELQLFLDLGEEGLGGTGFLFVTESQFNTFTQQLVREAPLTTLAGGARCIFLCYVIRQLIPQGIDLDFQFGFVKEVKLARGFLTARCELLDLLMAQQFFEDLDAGIPVLDGLIALLQLMQKGFLFRGD